MDEPDADGDLEDLCVIEEMESGAHKKSNYAN